MSIEAIYVLYVALTALGLGATVTAYVPFLQSIGLSLGQVGLINAGFWLVYGFLELPTGMLADGRSRTWSIKWGIVLQAAGSLSYFLASGFWSALWSEAMLAVGMAFTSGAHQAWLVDALKADGRYEARNRAFGTAAMLRGVAMIAGGVAGNWLSASTARGIWIPYAVLAIPSFLLVCRHMDGRGDPEMRVTEREALRKSVAFLRETHSLKWALAAFLLSGLMLPFNHYWSPYFIATAGRASVAWVWPAMYLSLIPGGYIVRHLGVSSRHEAAALVGALFAIGAGMAAIPLFGIGGAMFAVAVHEAGRGALDPLLDGYVHHRVDSDHRATYASLQSFVGKLGFTVIPLAVWFAIRGMPDTSDTISFVWIAAGSILACAALLLWVFRPKGS